MKLTKQIIGKILKKIPSIEVDGIHYVNYDTIQIKQLPDCTLVVHFCRDGEEIMYQKYPATTVDLKAGDTITIPGLVGLNSIRLG